MIFPNHLIQSLILIIVSGYLVRFLGNKLRLPAALPLILLGVLLGPEGFDTISKDYISLAPYLSKIAFVILLIRTGIGLSKEMLKNFLPTALFIGLIPLLIEGTAFVFLGKTWLFDKWIMAFLFSAIIMCESPAIIFPTMLKIRKNKLGTDKNIPDKMMIKTLANIIITQTLILLMIDIILKTEGESVSFLPYYLFPLNILLGITLGVTFGKIFPWRTLINLRKKNGPFIASIILVSFSSFLFFTLGHFKVENILCIIFFTLFSGNFLKSEKPFIEKHLYKIWNLFEVFIFFNLGFHIKLSTFENVPTFFKIFIIILVAHLLRQLVLGFSLYKSEYTKKEAVYIGFAQFPKATIQAVYGGLPLIIFSQLNMFHLFKEAELILMGAVFSITITAPLGAFFIDKMASRLLKKESYEN